MKGLKVYSTGKWRCRQCIEHSITGPAVVGQSLKELAVARHNL